MLIVPPQIKVFASLAPTDMRKSSHGLIGIIEKELRLQIENGDLFLFFNRRRDRLKVLFFTGDGTVILYKKQESDYLHFFIFTETGDLSHNLAGWLAAADGMDASPTARSSRRCWMSRDAAVTAPPRAQRSRSGCGSINSGLR